MRNPGYISRADHAARRDRASGRLAGENVMDRAERAEEEQLAEHRAWIAEKSEKVLDGDGSSVVSSLLSTETPILEEKEQMADLKLKRVTRDGRHVLYEIPGVGAVRFARGVFAADGAPPATIPIGDVFVTAKPVKEVDPVRAAKRAEAKANQLGNAQRLAAKHEERAVKAKAKLAKILAKSQPAGAAVNDPAAEAPAVETSEQPAA